MRRHWDRSVYYVIGKGLVREPSYITGGGSPHAAQPDAKAAQTWRVRDPQPIGKFGLMFERKVAPEILSDEQRQELVARLIHLGRGMNAELTPKTPDEEESSIPAGYTYLGQFIAHEISFDKTKEPVSDGATPGSYRSPQIDLDSLYGLGPTEEPWLYQDSARLKIGETLPGDDLKRTFLNDLPRTGYGHENPREALIADPRNDENLATAQTHLAFASFHNKVVDTLQRGEGFRKACPLHPEGCPPDKLFECARREVIQHFHAIILEDFLPRILDESGLECVRSGGPRFYDTECKEGVFMPLEFSVAAFRFGHSMVRSSYEWNYIHCSEKYRSGAAKLNRLFQFSNFSGDLGGAPRLKSDWVIDWRRFYDFGELPELGYAPDGRTKNLARKIDTVFNLHLDQISGYPHVGFAEGLRSITVRNLLRGLSLDLPTGEEVAACIGKTPLGSEQIAGGPHEELLGAPPLRGKTPLWYYVLKEAELNKEGESKGKLGPVGSCIVAETLVGLIKKSPYSILKDPEWRPRFGDHAKDSKTRSYKMIELLAFADVVDPVGEFLEPR